jgi:hypothetical protein
MSFSFKLSRSELFLSLLAMQFHHLFLNIIYILCFVMMSFISVDVASNLDDHNFLIKVIVFLIFELIPVAVVFGLPVIITIFSAFSGKNRPLLENRNMIFNEDFFVCTTENSTSEVKWQALQRVVVTGSFLFLYLSQAGAIIIPKRVFATGHEWSDFIELCRSKLKKNKH